MKLYLKESTGSQPGLFDQLAGVSKSVEQHVSKKLLPPLNEESPIIMLLLWQPWASFCLWLNPFDGSAEKQVETRHWEIEQRGLLAIHATKALTPDAKYMIENDSVFRETLVSHVGDFGGDWRELTNRLTFGAVVGVAALYEIQKFETDAEAFSWGTENYPAREKTFGGYAAGRFGWRLRHPIAFDVPIPARGFQKFGAARPHVRTEIMARLSAANYFEKIKR